MINTPGTSSNSRHGTHEDQLPFAADGGAIQELTPDTAEPRRSIRSSHLIGDTHTAFAATGRATGVTKPILPVPGQPIGDHPLRGTHRTGVTKGRAASGSKPNRETPGHPITGSHHILDDHPIDAAGGDDQSPADTHGTLVIAVIQELWRRRQAWHRAEKSLTLQAKAVCRRFVGGDKDEVDKLFAAVDSQERDVPHTNEAVAVAILPLMMAKKTIEGHRGAVEKELVKRAKTLPIAPYIEGIRGMGMLSLAALVGECGNIGSYKSASAVWKRMGLAVINGIRQRRIAGPEALEHGYSPQRRSVAWNIGVSLMRSQKAGDAYRDFYDKEKEKQLRREIDGKPLTAGHAHNRAVRHMTKKLLAEIYGQWRKLERKE